LNSLLQKLVEAWRNRAISAKVASFALVGVVNTLIDVNVFAIAYAIFGIPLIPANLLAWLIAVSFSYAANAMTTFGPETGQVLTIRDYVKFVMSGAAGGLIATTALVIASGFFSVITGPPHVALRPRDRSRTRTPHAHLRAPWGITNTAATIPTKGGARTGISGCRSALRSAPVCTENLSSGVVVVKSAKDGV
jgi:putative flippase GtrA